MDYFEIVDDQRRRDAELVRDLQLMRDRRDRSDDVMSLAWVGVAWVALLVSVVVLCAVAE